MNRAKKRHQQKLAKKAAGNASPAPEQQTLTIEQAIELGVQHQNAGDLPKAEGIYKQILEADPNQPDALHLLGMLAHKVGNHDIAVELISKAIAIRPDYTEAHINLGNALRNLGQFDAAVDSYKKALAIRPDFALTYINLGIALKERGKLDEAVDSYNKALAIDPDFAEAHYNLGNALKQQGRLDDAVNSYHKALAIRADYIDAHYNLGNTLQNLGRFDEAVISYHKVIDIKPDYAEAHYNLGAVLQGAGKLDDAIASYHKALVIKPDFPEAHYSIAAALHKTGKLDEAVGSYQKAVAINPDHAEAYSNLGAVFIRLGKRDEAVASYLKALTINPDFAEAHCNMGAALTKLGKLDEAVDSCHKALAINPDFAEAHYNLGNALKSMGKMDEAVASYQKAIAIKPDYADAHYNLGNALDDQGNLDEAVKSYQNAIDVSPDYAKAYNNLGNSIKELGLLEDAIASYQKALAVKPDFIDAHDNMLLSEQYRLGHDAGSLFELHCRWDEQHGEVFRADWPVHSNDPDPERRLRIGFVSPDLGRHPVGYFVAPMLGHLGAGGIETVCYSDRTGDDLTENIKAAADIWRDVDGVSDDDLNRMIIDDQIDILVDLTGHSANNRLLVFARKPAPLQVAWAGYVGTTGLAAIDYLVSDIYSTPPEDEPFYSEKVIRMPDGWLCYEPPEYAPDVGPPPSQQNGYITFCSFSNPTKVNQQVVSLWARILEQVPDSRLLIKYRGIDSIGNTDRIEAMFEAEGIDRTRLMLEGRSPHPELLGRYNEADIALDPFPYSGGLTTYEALWMGVPVITLPGDTFASRHSLSHLSTIGLPELVAGDADDYVALAVGLANDTARLAGLRSELRDMMATSPICDGKKFAEGFAGLMRKIWRDWCALGKNDQ